MVRVDFATGCFALAVIVLGHALQLNNGFFDPIALGWVTGALGLVLGGVLFLKQRTSPSSRGETLVCAVMAAGVAWQTIALVTSPPGFYVQDTADIRIFRVLVLCQAVFVAAGVLRIGRLRHLWFPALLAAHLAAGVWMMRASPDPHIDVAVVHRAAIDALLHGRDPYRIIFENIYGAEASLFYNPNALVGKSVVFGYPYPPVSLLLAVPGQVLLGDYRYAELAALVLGAGFIGYMRAGPVAKLAAALLLTTPRVFFVLEQGWTEPMAVLLLSVVVFCLIRMPSAAPWAAGLMIMTKQYFALAGPPLLRLMIAMRWRAWRFLLPAGLVAFAVAAPFALWHPQAFFDTVVMLQTREPFRIDSLSYLSWAARQGWGSGSFLWSIAAGSTGLAAAMIRTPNTAAGFAASIALSSLALFAFGSKAFCNYYFFVIAAVCCTIAALPGSSDR